MYRLINNVIIFSLTLIATCSFAQDKQKMGNCQGHFVNPITDICWDCLFPISIGSTKVTSSDYPDTENPSKPLEVCPIGSFYRVGLNIGFWEPFALTDVTPQPYCLVNLGGVQMKITHVGHGGREDRSPSNSGAFYYVHWYKYPVIYWLQIITSMACVQAGEFDIAYLTELDPLWNDDQLSFLINPEASLFANNVTQAACSADAIQSQSGLPIDSLFWCAGTQGGMYPLDGAVFDEKSPVQAALLLSERMDYKMHREGLILESSPNAGSGFNGPICHQYPMPILPKSRYRYQMVNTIAAAKKCYPFGHTVATWEAGHIYPAGGDLFGFLIWKKRNCTFM